MSTAAISLFKNIHSIVEKENRLLYLVGAVAHFVAGPFLFLAALYDLIANFISGPEGSTWQSLKILPFIVYFDEIGMVLPCLISALAPTSCAKSFSAGWVETVESIYPACARPE